MCVCAFARVCVRACVPTRAWHWGRGVGGGVLRTGAWRLNGTGGSGDPAREAEWPRDGTQEEAALERYGQGQGG